MSLRCWSIWVYRTRRWSGDTASPPAASAGGAESVAGERGRVNDQVRALHMLRLMTDKNAGTICCKLLC